MKCGWYTEDGQRHGFVVFDEQRGHWAFIDDAPEGSTTPEKVCRARFAAFPWAG